VNIIFESFYFLKAREAHFVATNLYESLCLKGNFDEKQAIFSLMMENFRTKL